MTAVTVMSPFSVLYCALCIVIYLSAKWILTENLLFVQQLITKGAKDELCTPHVTHCSHSWFRWINVLWCSCQFLIGGWICTLNFEGNHKMLIEKYCIWPEICQNKYAAWPQGGSSLVIIKCIAVSIRITIFLSKYYQLWWKMLLNLHGYFK